MDRRDYYVEYYEVLDRVLSDYVNHLREEKEYWLKMGRHDVGVPLINLLFWQFTWHREEYDRLRKEGKSCGEALGSVKEILADKQVEEWERQEEEYKIYDHEWYEALAPYGGQLVIYIYNARQLAYLTPLIEFQDFPIRGKAVYLRIKRRRWEDPSTGQTHSRDWSLVSTGTRITAEFGGFLKELLR